MSDHTFEILAYRKNNNCGTNRIVDPTKVTRSALQNAESISSMILTTESWVVNKKEKSCGCGGHVEGAGMPTEMGY